MVAHHLRLKLLNHLFYGSETTNGVYTAPFIGDLALTYAMRKACIAQWETPEYRKKPYYEEIRDWGFYLSVAQPIQYTHTEVYTRNTLFNVDGYIDVAAIEQSGKSPFKNLYHMQGIQAGSEFSCVMFAPKEMSIPPAIRIGYGRETLVQVTTEPNPPTSVWLNIYTEQQVFNRLHRTADLLTNVAYEREYVMEQYVLLKHIPFEVANQIVSAP